jgi:Na+-transporting NADH:ubiquinone oxidoreductase subunit NqrB
VRASRLPRLPDPRVFQILFLGCLLGAGAWLRDFSIRPEQVALTFLSGSITQAALNRATGRSGVGLRSSIITCLSLSILLRADNLLAHPLTAAGAIALKFLIRVRGKHLLNPANGGILLALLCLPGTWVSPGQWGQDVAFAAWFVVLGALVVHRAHRSDISWTFLAFYLGAIAFRVLWLGQSVEVWLHQLRGGALLLFAFFMISDPMTIPNHPRGRLVHAALVAAVAYAWQYGLYRTNGLLWALFLAAPAVPLWDAIWPAPKFEWLPEGGRSDDSVTTSLAPSRALRAAGASVGAVR